VVARSEGVGDGEQIDVSADGLVVHGSDEIKRDQIAGVAFMHGAGCAGLLTDPTCSLFAREAVLLSDSVALKSTHNICKGW
jgi:hypothetical protein